MRNIFFLLTISLSLPAYAYLPGPPTILEYPAGRIGIIAGKISAGKSLSTKESTLWNEYESDRKKYEKLKASFDYKTGESICYEDCIVAHCDSITRLDYQPFVPTMCKDLPKETIQAAPHVEKGMRYKYSAEQRKSAEDNNEKINKQLRELEDTWNWKQILGGSNPLVREIRARSYQSEIGAVKLDASEAKILNEYKLDEKTYEGICNRLELPISPKFQYHGNEMPPILQLPNENARISDNERVKLEKRLEHLTMKWENYK